MSRRQRAASPCQIQVGTFCVNTLWGESPTTEHLRKERMAHLPRRIRIPEQTAKVSEDRFIIRITTACQSPASRPRSLPLLDRPASTAWCETELRGGWVKVSCSSSRTMLTQVHDVLEGKGDKEVNSAAIADCFSHQTAAFVRLVVWCSAHDQPEEAAFDPADGVSAKATLTSQGRRCSYPSLPEVPSSASAAARGSGIVCSDGCSKITC